MKKDTNCFKVASWKEIVIIVVEGYATQNNSLLFKDFVDMMLWKGFRKFIVDLHLCKGMDSTFMGVLLSIINFKGKNNADGETIKPDVILINTNEYHMELLECLGLSKILTIKNEKVELPSLQMKILKEESTYTLERRLKMIHKVHEYLVALNEKNRKQFGEFLELFKQESG